MRAPRLLLSLVVGLLGPGCAPEKATTCGSACEAGTGTSTGDASTSSGAGTGTSASPTGTSASPTGTSSGEPTGSESSTGPAPGACEGETPRVRLVTSLGDMVVMLDAVNAPITVANFLDYVEADFYAGTIFHRVVDGFVIQGGGFTPDLTMKPTQPPIPLEVMPGLTHIDGALAMARTPDPDSATAQFYICDGPQHFLDGDYAVFGLLVEGHAVRDAISAVATDADGLPGEPVIILSARCE